MIIRQTNANGTFVDTLLQVVALDDIVGLIAYSISISIALSSNSNQNFNDISHTFHLTKQIALKIRKCFSISEILDNLSYSENNDLFKDEDLTYIKDDILMHIYSPSTVDVYKNFHQC